MAARAGRARSGAVNRFPRLLWGPGAARAAIPAVPRFPPLPRAGGANLRALGPRQPAAARASGPRVPRPSRRRHGPALPAPRRRACLRAPPRPPRGAPGRCGGRRFRKRCWRAGGRPASAIACSAAVETAVYAAAQQDGRRVAATALLQAMEAAAPCRAATRASERRASTPLLSSSVQATRGARILSGRPAAQRAPARALVRSRPRRRRRGAADSEAPLPPSRGLRARRRAGPPAQSAIC
jgi:hypothetical protein